MCWIIVKPQWYITIFHYFATMIWYRLWIPDELKSPVYHIQSIPRLVMHWWYKSQGINSIITSSSRIVCVSTTGFRYNETVCRKCSNKTQCRADSTVGLRPANKRRSYFVTQYLGVKRPQYFAVERPPHESRGKYLISVDVTQINLVFVKPTPHPTLHQTIVPEMISPNHIYQ